jgi:MFS family permease
MARNDDPPRAHPWPGSAPLIVLAVASAGWVFDVYEGQLFTIFKTPMFTELSGGDRSAVDWQGNLGFAIFLLGGAAGGLFFAVLSDRFGRARMMALTILIYSVFSSLTAFAQSTVQVHVLRFLVALGTGGEWAIAAALVAETFPSHSRARAAGVFHASSVIGTGLASVTGMLFQSKGSWRWGFLLGLLPALLVLWIRVGIRETRPGTSGDVKSSTTVRMARPLGELRELFGSGPWRSRAFVGLGLATIGLATFWGIFAWSPELAGTILGAGLSEGRRQQMGNRAYLLMNFTGGLLGLLAFAPIASWRGRRFAFAVYHIGAALTAPACFLGVTTYVQALWFLPVMAFFVLGMHAGYAIYFPELFPRRLRATGSSACFNLGRVFGAVILLIRGTIGTAICLRWAVVAMSGLFWIGLLILWFAPETRGKELPD